MSTHEDSPPNAPARQSRPGSDEATPRDPCHGGTTIQKVEIVITSDQSPSKIARAVHEQLSELGKRQETGRKVSPFLDEWSRKPVVGGPPFPDLAEAQALVDKMASHYRNHARGDEKSDAPPADSSRRLCLQTRYEALRSYLQTTFAERDWHAVSDAANDLRCVEVELRCLGAKP
jgi:hypothetical protein